FSSVDQNIRARTHETANLLSAQVQGFELAFNELDQRIIERARLTTSELDTQAETTFEHLSQLEERVRSTAGTASSALVHAAFEAEKHLGETLGRTSTLIRASLEEVQGELKSSTENAVKQVGEQLVRSQTDLVSAADTISQTFTAVNEHISSRTVEAVRTLEERTRDLNSVLASRSFEISRILDETARPLVERFEAGGAELQQAIEAVTERTSERLQQQNAMLISALAERTTDTLHAVERSRAIFMSDVEAVLEKLTHSSGTLGTMVQSAAREMLQADEKLSGTAINFAENAQKAAESFSNSVSIIDVNSGRLSDFSEKTLTSLTAIAARFGDHSRILESASQLLDKAQHGILSNIEGRQEALRSLADGLVEKSEQIERVIKSLDGLVEGMVDRTEQRSRKSADTIRHAIEEVLESATTRFAGATEEIRRTATDVRDELEKTRADVKRGIVELPEEAKQSTTAMRRAITEQISALKELSSIVARTGKMQERPVESPRPVAPAMPRASADNLAPATRLMERPAAIRPTRSVERPVASPSHQPQNGGWIRDLLQSASQDELAPVSAPVEPGVRDTLSSLSQEITRSIDHEAAAELWERYRRGERNVFTRRLYTLKGQQTFDSIQQKYRLDASFRAAVDQFCRDFERLLAGAAGDDRDNSISQTYLASETGKVYTMLAHASGRLR